jgi:uncharacterized LabA/DUF88 family protein
MSRAAIFVDAGYLFAQGSVALNGTKLPRPRLSLNITAVIAELTAVVKSNAVGCDLLRVYWYDGASGTKGPTLEHQALAHTDSVKLRLGFINSTGQQKGVDSLIVTDIIDLARNHAISDAILLSGDEDVRIGVQIAQQFGVRIHLVGIVPLRGSQSRALQQESDTTREWDVPTVAKFLTITANLAPPPAAKNPAVVKNPDPALALTEALYQGVVADLLQTVDAKAVLDLTALWESGTFGIPPEYDGKLLAKGREAAGRELTLEERKHLRARFKDAVKAK